MSFMYTGCKISSRITLSTVVLISKDTTIDNEVSKLIRKNKCICVDQEWLDECLNRKKVINVSSYQRQRPKLQNLFIGMNMDSFAFYVEDSDDNETVALIAKYGGTLSNEYDAVIRLLRTVTDMEPTGVNKWCLTDFDINLYCHHKCPSYHIPTKVRSSHAKMCHGKIFVVSVCNTIKKKNVHEVFEYLHARYK